MDVKYFKILIPLLFFYVNVYADECSYKEQANLNKEAALVQANYELKEIKNKVTSEGGGEYDQINYNFIISFYNITENLALEVTDSYTREKKSIYYSDTDNGKYTLTSEDQDNIISYDIIVYSNTDNCGRRRLRSFSFTKPKYNPYSEYLVCKGHEDLPYCQTFVTKEVDMDITQIVNKITEIENGKDGNGDSTKENKFLKFLKENYLYIIGGTVLIAGGVVGVIIYRKKRVL